MKPPNCTHLNFCEKSKSIPHPSSPSKRQTFPKPHGARIGLVARTMDKGAKLDFGRKIGWGVLFQVPFRSEGIDERVVLYHLRPITTLSTENPRNKGFSGPGAPIFGFGLADPGQGVGVDPFLLNRIDAIFFRKVRANFCLLPYDTSQEPNGNYLEKLVQMNFFIWDGWLFSGGFLSSDKEEHSMDQCRSRLKLSENFERHWSILISGEIHMDPSLVHTFSSGKSYGPMVLKVLLKFPPTLALVHGWLFPVR